MTTRSALIHISATLTVLALVLFAPNAYAAGDCGGNWVDGAGTSSQNVGCASEDDYLSGSQYYGDCYGACGRGCSWYNCGSGGSCQTHDYYTRRDGLWSGNAMSYFPAAISQWGRCVAGKGAQWLTGWMRSKWTGASGNANPRVGP